MKPTIAERISEGLELKGIKQAELARMTGIAKSSISTYITGEYEPKQKNIFRIAKALGVSEAWLLGNDHIEEAKNTPSTLIPVRGKVAAGKPIECVEDVRGHVELPRNLVGRGEYIALEITGKSMEPSMLAGDVIIVRLQKEVENEEIAVVVIDGEDATVKQVKVRENGLMLIPFNREFEPMFFTPNEVEEKPIRILGKVVGLIRMYE